MSTCIPTRTNTSIVYRVAMLGKLKNPNEIVFIQPYKKLWANNAGGKSPERLPLLVATCAVCLRRCCGKEVGKPLTRSPRRFLYIHYTLRRPSEEIVWKSLRK